MKKSTCIACACLAAAYLSLAGNVLAGDPLHGNTPIMHINKKFTPPKVPKTFPKLLPDLIATHIKAVPNGQGQCYLRITLKNQGIGPIPDIIYTGHRSAIQVFANGHPSGMDLSVFDPAKKLQRPGGTLTKDWFRNSPLLHSGKDTTIRIIVDAGKTIEEANEANNDLTQSVQCLK